MKPQAMIDLLNKADEDDVRLDELGDRICELADDEKKIDAGVIEALFKIHERLNDPPQALFNALESCVMGAQEKTVRKLARESMTRDPNNCNLQLVGAGRESVALLKKTVKRPKLDPEIRSKTRRRDALPVLEKIKERVDHAVNHVAPRSTLGEAIHYMREQWPKLLTIAENSCSPFASFHSVISRDT